MKKNKRKLRKNKKSIIIELPLAFKHHQHVFTRFDKELVYQPATRGRKLVNKDLITMTASPMVTHIFFQAENSYPVVHVVCSIKDLEKFVKLTKKRVKKYGSCWNHLNPELSFLVTEK